MEHVGFLGILKLTTHLILRNSKHFLCIASVLALPNALLLPFLPSSSSPAAACAHAIAQLSSLYAAFHGHASVPAQDTTPPPFPFALLLVTLCFSLFFPLITQPLLSFSVSRACLHKSVSLSASISAVPRSAKNLVLTVLSVTAILLGFCVAMALVMASVAAAAAFFALGVDPTIFVVIWLLVMVGGGVYFAVSWSLAETVAVMEEKGGWEAMERSRYLLDGRKGVALGQAVLFGGCLMFFPIGVSEGASVHWRWSCAVLSVGLQAMVTLWSMAAMVVLYLSCKARFNESLDSLVALSSQFGPHENKYMNIESIPF